MSQVIDEFLEVVGKTEDFFYQVSVPRTATNYMLSLVEYLCKRPRYDLDVSAGNIRSYLSDDEKKKDPILYNSHEPFWHDSTQGVLVHLRNDDRVEAPDNRKVVVQIRNPIDVLYSLQGLGLNPGIGNYNRFIQRWCHDFNGDQRVYGNRFIFVYEEFVKDRVGTVKKLMDFLEIPRTEEEISEALDYIGDREKYFKTSKSNHKHLNNLHTLSDGYKDGRDNYKKSNVGMLDDICVENLKKYYKGD